MMLVGLTGGMGSGKTTVANMFRELGISVYDSDKEAKRLMRDLPEIRKQLVSLFGEKAYDGKELNRTIIAEKVFQNKELLNSLNQIVHPQVRKDFQNWTREQEGPYVLQEAAILFENGGYQSFDKMILVTAPKKLRIQRIRERDKLTTKAILQRMKHQWPEKQKKELADFVIRNKILEITRNQVLQVHYQLLALRNSV